MLYFQVCTIIEVFFRMLNFAGIDKKYFNHSYFIFLLVNVLTKEVRPKENVLPVLEFVVYLH